MRSSKIDVILLLVFIGLLCDSIFGQTTREPMVTDRPDFTESAEVIPIGMYQFEFGYTFSHVDSDKEHTIGELLARIPIHGFIELRVGINSYAVFQSSAVTISGLQDASLGFKLEVPGGSNIKTALLVATTVPTGKNEFGEEELQPEAKLALSLPVSEKLGVSSNAGYSYSLENSNRFSQFSNSLALGYSILDQMGAYLEYYGFYPGSKDGSDLLYLNGGITYRVTPNFQLDIRAGEGLNGIDLEYFVGIGAGIRL